MALEIGPIPKTAMGFVLYSSPLPFPLMVFSKALLLNLNLLVRSTLCHRRTDSLTARLGLNELSPRVGRLTLLLI